MELADILPLIESDLPDLPCRPGCVDCCTVALWSPAEWRRLPEEHKINVGSVTVPVRGPSRTQLAAILPVQANQVISLAMRTKLVVVKAVNNGLLMTAVGLENIRCPFAQEGMGCTVYDYRPFVCRIMGSATIGRLHCPRNIETARQLPEDIIMQRFLLWTNLLDSHT